MNMYVFIYTRTSRRTYSTYELQLYICLVLAEDAIKSALKDYKMKREKNSAASKSDSSPDAQSTRATP